MKLLRTGLMNFPKGSFHTRDIDVSFYESCEAFTILLLIFIQIPLDRHYYFILFMGILGGHTRQKNGYEMDITPSIHFLRCIIICKRFLVIACLKVSNWIFVSGTNIQIKNSSKTIIFQRIRWLWTRFCLYRRISQRTESFESDYLRIHHFGNFYLNFATCCMACHQSRLDL